MQYWILTFQRPKALNRLIQNLGNQGVKVNIWSNSPIVQIESNSEKFVEQLVINPVNTSESTSWCSRSWNSIYVKGFMNDNKICALQDDTDVSGGFINWLNNVSGQYDFIFGWAGDQFHYIHKNVVKRVGWWDERYLGCYCGDADYLKRVYFEYDREKISVEETHGWGFTLNPSGIRSHIIPSNFGQTGTIIDSNYVNQHHEYENMNYKNFDRKSSHDTNPVIAGSRKHYRDKWGIELTGDSSVINHYERHLGEIDWYPWATAKFNKEDQ